MTIGNVVFVWWVMRGEVNHRYFEQDYQHVVISQ